MVCAGRPLERQPAAGSERRRGCQRAFRRVAHRSVEVAFKPIGCSVVEQLVSLAECLLGTHQRCRGDRYVSKNAFAALAARVGHGLRLEATRRSAVRTPRESVIIGGDLGRRCTLGDSQVALARRAVHGGGLRGVIRLDGLRGAGSPQARPLHRDGRGDRAGQAKPGKEMCGSKSTSGLVCEINDGASFHVDEEFRDTEFLVGRGRTRFALPKNVNVTKHTVNGSFHEMGSAYNDGGTEQEPFDCSGTLAAPEGRGELGEMLTWRKRGRDEDFTAGVESYGFLGVGSGSGICRGESWFGGIVYFSGESVPRFDIPTSDLGKREFTKTIGGRPMSEHCGHWSTESGSCKYSWDWHAVVKFSRKREITF